MTELPYREIRNHTPHDLTVTARGRTRVYKRCDPEVRVTENPLDGGTLDGFPVQIVGMGEVKNLPEPEEGVAFLVSMFTCQRAPHRRDLFYPHPQLRDKGGNIIGAAGFAQVPAPAARE